MAAEHQRIHPVHDVEAQHRPLVPQNIAKSDDKGIPHRTFPVMHSKPPKRRRSCCCRFMCWTLSILLILIIAIAITIGILYLVFRPKLPKYSVDQLQLVHKAWRFVWNSTRWSMSQHLCHTVVNSISQFRLLLIT